jgi:sulfur transfer complex TusBCD TusB component (DsrH family)
MIINCCTYPISKALEVRLGQLDTNDHILCTGNGVYGLKVLQNLAPQVNVAALEKDCVLRGIQTDNAITLDTLIQWQQSDPIWLKL